MNHFIPIETPGGVIWAEIEETEESKRLTLTSSQDQANRSFRDAAAALKENAQYLCRILEELAPQEIEVAFAIKVGVEAGIPFFGLAKASSEGSYTVTLKWKPEESSASD
jgi:hypothetical protein